MENLSLPGVNAELEILRKPEIAHRPGDCRYVQRHLPPELRHVAHIIDTLVEAARKLWRDGLDRNALIGNRRQNNQQLGRRLRRVRLVHRNFCDEISLPLRSFNLAIDLPCFFHREQKLRGRRTQQVRCNVDGLTHAFESQRSGQIENAVSRISQSPKTTPACRSRRPRRWCRNRRARENDRRWSG